MPQTKARHKHIRQSAKRTRRNRKLKEEIKYATRAALDTAREGDQEEIQTALTRAYKAIDKAAKVGTFHSRRKDRKKSVLARQVAELQAAE